MMHIGLKINIIRKCTNSKYRQKCDHIFFSKEKIFYFRSKIYNIQVNINIGVVAPIAWFPFGGAKHSFFSTLRAQGYEVLKFFTQERVIIEGFQGSTKIECD